MKKLLTIVLLLCTLMVTPVYATESANEEPTEPTMYVTERVDLKADSTVRIEILQGDITECSVGTTVIPKYSSKDNYYQFKAPYGTHYIMMSCVDDADYNITVTPLDINPYLEYEEITIIDGYVAKNTVINANAPVRYLSSDTGVFTVDGEGNITTRGAGEADFVAQVGATTLKCKIKVLENKYTASKLKLSDCRTFAMVSRVYAVYYTDTGMCVKYTVGNNTNKIITSFTPTLTLYDNNHKIIYLATLPTMKHNVKRYSVSNFKLFIKNKDLPEDVINLTACKPSMSIRCSYKN